MTTFANEEDCKKYCHSKAVQRQELYEKLSNELRFNIESYNLKGKERIRKIAELEEMKKLIIQETLGM